jgi:hypothetical protein
MAAKKYFVDIDLNRNELVNAVLHNTTEAAADSGAVTGQIIFDTGTDTLKYYDGSVWQSAETRLDGALQYKGAIAANAAAPVSTPQQGDLYVFNTPGTAENYGGGVVEVGDFAIYDGSEWDVIQGNTIDATEEVKGVVQLATDQDTKTGSNTVKAITPSNLTAWAGQENKTVTRKRVFTEQDIETTGTTLTHEIGSDNPHVVVYDSDHDEVDVLVEKGTGTVTLTVNGTTLENTTVVITA